MGIFHKIICMITQDYLYLNDSEDSQPSISELEASHDLRFEFIWVGHEFNIEFNRGLTINVKRMYTSA